MIPDGEYPCWCRAGRTVLVAGIAAAQLSPLVAGPIAIGGNSMTSPRPKGNPQMSTYGERCDTTGKLIHNCDDSRRARTSASLVTTAWWRPVFEYLYTRPWPAAD